MWTSLSVFLVAAAMCAAAGFWVLRAYRRAGGGAQSPRPALMASGLVALAALGTYLAIGRPDLPDAPYQQRLDALLAALRGPTPPVSVTPDQRLAVWMYLAREHPNALTPHLEAANTLLSLGREREATIEYERALRIDPNSADALLGMGRALTLLDGRVSPQALDYFVQAGQHGDNPAPWIYQAMAAMQAGRNDDARRLWGEAGRRMAPDDPRRAMAQSMSQGPLP